MQTAKYSLLLLLAVLLTACGDNTYYLLTDNAQGLEEGDVVYRQGIAVGVVEDVRFADSDVRIEIDLEEPLYERQGFSIRRAADGPLIELDRPTPGADPLSSGATVHRYGETGDRFGGLAQLGELIGERMGEIVIPDPDDLERSLADLEEHLEARAEELEEVAQAWGERVERQYGAPGHEDFSDLEGRLRKWSEEENHAYESFSEELDAWAQDYEGDIEDIARVMQRATEEHPVGSAAWKRAVRKGLR